MRYKTLVFLVAGLWLLIDFLALPRSTGVKQMLGDLWSNMFPTARTSHPWHESATIHRDPEGISLDFDSKRFEEPSRVGDAVAYPTRHLYGWWAPTSEAYNTRLEVYPYVALTPAEMSDVRNLFAGHMDVIEMPEFAQWIREGRTRVVRRLPWGFVRDAAALICGAIVLIGLADRMRSAMRRLAADRRMRDGRCPKCGYDVRGAFEQPCSECGWRLQAR